MEEGMFDIRTDLALETQERISRSDCKLHGVVFEEQTGPGKTRISTVEICSENAARRLRRPKGRYITIENADMADQEEKKPDALVGILAKQLKEMAFDRMRSEKENERVERDGKKNEEKCEEKKISILVVGLGNRNITSDSLGPLVVDNLFITRHVIREFGQYAYGDEKTCQISAVVPGVLAQTGMEAIEILKGIVRETKPGLVITVDALAARSVGRLVRTIQLTDTGVTPGSGVGNQRNAINRQNLGVPVISIGVPTVVDAVTIVSDALNEQILPQSVLPQLRTMIVTPKDVDASVKKISVLISKAIHQAFL